MLLSELAGATAHEKCTGKDTPIASLQYNSRKVGKGDLFFCVVGTFSDGHAYAAQAVAAGAAALVVEHELPLPVPQVIVGNTRIAMAEMAAAFYGYPARGMRIVGVTGTNGKTSTTYMLKAIAEQCGLKVGLIGTIRNLIGARIVDTERTTPESVDLQRILREMKDEGVELVVMEASSHSLDQRRVHGIEFETAVFTNLTQDHLDYHGTMENYYQAKKLLFSRCDTAVIDTDDDYGKRLYSEVTCPKIAYGSSNQADFYADAIKLRADGTSFWLCCGGKSYPVDLHLTGMFNVSNALAAVAACCAVGMSVDDVRKALETCTGVRGRCEVIPTGRDFTVICDYAHTPDAVENILRSVKEYTKGRLICLFGCGGNRDATKRPKMAKAAAKYADFLVVTSDNPRDEEPEAIIADILAGLTDSDVPYEVVTDRKEAILRSMQLAQPEDVIVLAGKGHEDYQVLKGGVHIHMDEREIVRECLPLVPKR